MSRANSLVADVGGTNTRVALAEGATIDHSSIRRFANADHSGLGSILRSYLAGAGMAECTRACVAVAGPVRDGVATMTNLNWTIDPAGITRATGAMEVAVLNDLQAQGHGLDHLAPDSLRRVIATCNAPPAEATRLVIGVGTGFNAATVHDVPGGRLVVASESGHAGMPVRNQTDLRLLQHIEKTHGFAGIEDVLSGRGLERLHGWLQGEAGQSGGYDAAAIMREIANGESAVAVKAGQAFLRVLGAVVGDLALIHLPFGGIYLVGNVARGFTPYLEPFGFVDAFRDKGRFSEFMQNFPIYVIEDDYAALAGCAVWLCGQTGARTEGPKTYFCAKR